MKPVAILAVAALTALLLALWQPWASAPIEASGDGTAETPLQDPTAEPLRPAGAVDTAGSPAAAGERTEVDRPPAGTTSTTGAPPGKPGTFPVRVVDALGNPAPGVALALATRSAGRWYPVWRSATDAAGGATVEPDPATTATTATVFAVLPVKQPPRAEVTLRPTPAAPVVLTLPPVGAFDVELDHPDPQRLVGATVTVRNLDAPQDGRRWSTTARQATDGRAAFDFIGLSQRFRVTGSLKGGNVEAQVDIDGPIAAGERVRVRVSVVSETPILIAEIRDEKNRLLRSTNLDARMMAKLQGSSSSSNFGTATDEAGRIHLEVADSYGSRAERTLQLTHRTTGTDEAEDGIKTRSVRFTLPQLRPGDNDVGVLYVRPPTRVCAGVIVDAAGQPVAGARVSVRRKRPARRAPEGFYWAHTDIHAVRTAEDGEFEIVGELEASQYALFVECPRYLPIQAQPFVVGTRGIEIALQRAGTLRGRLRIDGALDRRRIGVELRSPGATAKATLGTDGRFVFEELATGVFDLEIRAYGDREPVLTRNAVRVEAGQETDLGDVDLRGKLHAIAFRVVDEAGRPVADAVAVVRHGTNDTSRLEGIFLDAGQGRLFARTREVELLVYAKDFSNRRIQGVRDGQRIVLPRSVNVAVRIPAGLRLPVGMHIRVALEPETAASGPETRIELRGEGRTSTMSGGAVPWLRAAKKRIGAEGLATVPIHGSGTYRVEWSLVRAQGLDQKLVPIHATPNRCTIHSGRPATLSTTMTQAHIDDAAKRLR